MNPLRSCRALRRMLSLFRGAQALGVSALAGSCSLGVHDHQTPEYEADVLLYDYSLAMAESGEVLASGCVATMGWPSFEGDLSIVVPLEQELVFEQRLVGRHDGEISAERPQEYFCELGPTDIGIGSAFKYNPKCLVAGNPEIFEIVSVELIGYAGEAVEWESNDSDTLPAVGSRTHIIQHEYGVVGVAPDLPPCEGGTWLGLYTAVPPENAEEE